MICILRSLKLIVGHLVHQRLQPSELGRQSAFPGARAVEYGPVAQPAPNPYAQPRTHVDAPYWSLELRSRSGTSTEPPTYKISSTEDGDHGSPIEMSPTGDTPDQYPWPQ